jgi:hypothetical protein
MSNSKTQNKEVKMVVASLEKMEEIVSKNKSLSWDGWNVVELIKTSGALYKPNGVKINGVWYIKNIFNAESYGWKVPSRYVE